MLFFLRNLFDYMVSAELWLPMLGNYGHFSFGNTYDVSNEGIAKAQNEAIKEIYASNSKKDIPDYYSPNGYTQFEKDMTEFGYKVVSSSEGSMTNKMHDGTKMIFKKAGIHIWGNYGNIEIIQSSDKYYSSYNYANHWWTHLFIDYLGYKGRGYK